MIAEDEAWITFDIVKTLRAAGAEIPEPAMSLARALELAAAEDFDCAILDVMLRDGLIFPAASIPEQRGAALIFYTGYPNREELSRNWLNAKILIKPAPPKTLVEAVRAACSQ